MIVSNELIMQTLLGFGTQLDRIRESIRRVEAEIREPAFEPIYMSVAQAAERYSLKRDAIYEIMHIADAPETLKVGKRRLLPIKDFDVFMKEYFQESKRI